MRQAKRDPNVTRNILKSSGTGSKIFNALSFSPCGQQNLYTAKTGRVHDLIVTSVLSGTDNIQIKGYSNSISHTRPPIPLSLSRSLHTVDWKQLVSTPLEFSRTICTISALHFKNLMRVAKHVSDLSRRDSCQKRKIFPDRFVHSRLTCSRDNMNPLWNSLGQQMIKAFRSDTKNWGNKTIHTDPFDRGLLFSHHDEIHTLAFDTHAQSTNNARHCCLASTYGP